MKIFTSLSLIASVLLCFFLVTLFGRVELPHQSRSVRLREVQEMQATTFLMMICLIGSGVGSVIIVRRARHLYREEALRNMNQLVVETQASQKRNADA